MVQVQGHMCIMSCRDHILQNGMKSSLYCDDMLLTKVRAVDQISRSHMMEVLDSAKIIRASYLISCELFSCSATQLNELLNDEDTVMKMVQNLPDFTKLVDENEQLSDQCIRLASKISFGILVAFIGLYHVLYEEIFTGLIIAYW